MIERLIRRRESVHGVDRSYDLRSGGDPVSLQWLCRTISRYPISGPIPPSQPFDNAPVPVTAIVFMAQSTL